MDTHLLNDGQLLRQYVEQRCERSFAEFMSRHVRLVFSVAHRLLGGDSQAAQDVTQAVFIEAAKQATGLKNHPCHAGWLHKTTRNLALNARRDRQRREQREQEAQLMQQEHAQPGPDLWSQVHPILDEALDAIPEADRNALLLRFFEGHALKRIGDRLGTSENAARMRVQRALERLRETLQRKGISATSDGLANLLLAHASVTLPAALAAGLLSSTTAQALALPIATSGPAPIVALKSFAIAMKTHMLSSAVVLIAATSVLLQQVDLRAKAETLASLRREAQTLEPLREKVQESRARRAEVAEVLRLRREAEERVRLRALEQSLRESLSGISPEAMDQAKAELALAEAARDLVVAKTAETELHLQLIQTTKSLGLAARILANENGGTFPQSFDELEPALSSLDEGTAIEHEEVIAKCEFFPHSKPLSIEDFSETFLFREKEPRHRIDGKWERIYGMTDGSAQTVVRDQNDFPEWEKQVMAKLESARKSPNKGAQ